MQRGESLPTNMNLKTRLESIRGFNDFKVIALKATMYHILSHGSKYGYGDGCNQREVGYSMSFEVEAGS